MSRTPFLLLAALLAAGSAAAQVDADRLAGLRAGDALGFPLIAAISRVMAAWSPPSSCSGAWIASWTASPRNAPRAKPAGEVRERAAQGQIVWVIAATNSCPLGPRGSRTWRRSMTVSVGESALPLIVSSRHTCTV